MLIHNFIGVILFYAVIVTFILAARLYGLGIRRNAKRGRKEIGKHVSPWPVVLAFAFSVLYLVLTLNYSSALALSPLALQHTAPFNYSNPQAASAIQSIIGRGGFSDLALSSPNGTSVFLTLTNGTINATNPLLIFMSRPNSNVVGGFSENSTLLGEMRFINSKGASEQVFDLQSNSTEFLVYNTNLELTVSNSSEMTAGAYLIMPIMDLPKSIPGCDSYDQLYSWLFNLSTKTGYNETVRQNILTAQCLSYNLFWA